MQKILNMRFVERIGVVLRSAILALVVFVISAPLLAQAPVGGLTGTVTDPKSAVIPGATVTVTRTDTGAPRTTTTGEDGKYLFTSLAPGEYTVRVSKQGFADQEKKVNVNVGLTGSLDFGMTLGTMKETVEVAAETPILDTVDNAIKAQVTADVIKDMPLNGRNFLDLAVIAPGAVPVPGDSFDPTKAGYTGVSIGGQAGRSTRISLDGGDINDEVVGTTTQNFSPEIIQEFQVSTSTFDLSTGASSSGAVNIITRSGTNEIHGTGYIYFRHSQLSAFPGLGGKRGKFKPQFDREQGGFWAGGPVKKDRLFWFANFEKNNQDQQAFITTGLAAGNPFDGAIAQPYDERTSTVKLDARLTKNHTAFVRWSRNDNLQLAFFPAGTGIAKAPAACTLCTNNAGLQSNLANQIVTGLTSTLGSKIVNDFRFNFSTLGNRISPIGTGPEIRIRSTNFKIGTNRIFPQSTFQNRWQMRDDISYQLGKHAIRSGFTWHHTQIFGTFQFWSPADIQLHRPSDVGRTFPASDADLLSWPVRFIRVGVGDPTLPVNTPGNITVNNRYSFYVEDAYRIHPRFTLNYGVNYRFDTNLVNFDMPKPAILSRVLNGELGPTKRDGNNWGGRLGFAWDVTGKGSTVVRGGYGVFYDTVIDNLRLFERSDLGPAGSGYLGFGLFSFTFPTFPSTGRVNVFTVANNYTLANAFRDLTAIRASLLSPPNPRLTNIDVNETAGILDRNLSIPYSNQFNIGAQHKLPGNMVFTGDFLYRLTLHEYVTVDVNHSAAAIGPLDGNLSTINVTKSIGKSKYWAGNFRVERRFSRGLGFSGTYVLSRFKALNGDGLGLGAGSYNNFNPNESFGFAGQDRKHRLVLTAQWAAPGYKGDNWIGRMWLKGWSLGMISALQSGPPLTVFVDRVSLTGSDNLQANLLDGAPFGAVGRTIGSVSQLNNLITNWNSTRAGRRDSFGRIIPTLALLPDDGSIHFGDSRIAQNLHIKKTFSVTERVKIDWITDIFNLFNVANLTGHETNTILPTRGDCPAGTCTGDQIRDLGFLQPTDRAVQVFGSGGPRAIQFALRVSF